MRILMAILLAISFGASAREQPSHESGRRMTSARRYFAGNSTTTPLPTRRPIFIAVGEKDQDPSERSHEAIYRQ